MRIRKRTPARAASPGPTPSLCASSLPPPPPQRQQQPKFWVQHEEENTGLQVFAVGEQKEQDQVPAASKNKNRAMGVPGPDPEPEAPAAGARLARCSRNDGKQWRCKGAAAPGYVFCDRHVAWSTRIRKPRASKKSRGASVLDSDSAAKEEPAEEEEEDTATTTKASKLGCNAGGGGRDNDDDGSHLPSSRKRRRTAEHGRRHEHEAGPLFLSRFNRLRAATSASIDDQSLLSFP